MLTPLKPQTDFPLRQSVMQTRMGIHEIVWQLVRDQIREQVFFGIMLAVTERLTNAY